ncbi:MAG: PAS domain S-box protein [Desulfobacteraceae bacterium]|nr:MAG: PAS domain S-box protein [Desulfobacteraceae bacterium]
MKKNHKTPTDAGLRRRAEKIIAETVAGGPDSPGISPEESASLIHELRVHQIELKMQNEELRRIQEELEKSRNRYSHLFDFSPFGYFNVDEKGIIEQVNLTAADMVGIARGSLIGKAFTRIIFRDDQDIYYRNRRALLESETPTSFELRLLKSGGAEFYARLECLVITDSETGFRQMRIAVSDITERKHQEETIRKTTRLSQERAQEITALLKSAKIVLSTSSFTKASRKIFDICRTLTGAAAGYLELFSDGGEDHKIVFFEAGDISCSIDTVLLMPIRALREKAYRFGKVVYDNNIFSGPWMEYLPAGHVRLESILLAPVMIHKQPVGILGFINKAGGFTKNDIHLITAFTQLAAVSLRNDRMLDALKQNENQLQKAYNEMEKQVQERTRDLTRSNQQLVMEIEERQEAEKLLLESRSMLQKVFDGIAEPLVLLDRDMRIRVMNNSAVAYFGVTDSRKVVGEICYNAFKGKTDFCEGCRIPLMLSKSGNVEFERKGFKNPHRYERVFLYIVKDRQGATENIIYRISDITERKLLDKQIIQNEKMAALGVMVSSIAHEINNPNAFIAFNLPILREYIEQLIGMIDHDRGNTPAFELCNMPYPEFRKDVFRLIGNLEHGSERINMFVSNLQEFSWTKYKGKETWVDLKALSKKAFDICRSKLKRTVQFYIDDIPETFPQIHTEPNALEHILINLLMNAAQASDKADSLIKLSAMTGETWLDHTIIEVTDNGCGIDAENIAHIFDPFFSTKAPNDGTGLGLYVCHDLVTGLGGRIEVETEVGKYSTFRVILPDMERRSENRVEEKI